MNKSELIQKILNEVKTSLERDIPENFDNFEITKVNDFGRIDITCTSESGQKEYCMLMFNWYN